MLVGHVNIFIRNFLPIHSSFELQVGPYSSHGHSSSSNMYTPIQPLSGINGAKSTCGSNGQHSVASLQMVWDNDQQMIREMIKRRSVLETTRRRQDDLSSIDRSSSDSVIEKDLKLVCQESAMVVKIFLDSFSGLFQDSADDISITWQRWNTKKYSTTSGLERSNMQIWINKYAMSTFSDHSNDDEGCENTDTI